MVFRELRGPDSPDVPSIPTGLRRWLADHSIDSLIAAGNPEILKGKRLALFCSQKCPGDLILRSYDLALALRESEVTVVGGFHAPMEKECLTFLLRGRAPIVVCPARSIEGMRVPTEWRTPLAEGRLLVLSAFSERQRRPTGELAALRNELVAALADEVLVIHAAPGGDVERRCRTALARGKPLLTLESPANRHLITLGARVVSPESFQRTETTGNDRITGGSASS